MTTTCSTVESFGAIFANTGSRTESTKTILSSAWVAIHATWSWCRRMFKVWSTEPMHGMAKYSSAWRVVLKPNVPTRSPGPTPSSFSAVASRPTRWPNSS